MDYRQLRPDELEAWYDLCDVAFASTPRAYFVAACQKDPSFDPSNTMVAVQDGKLCGSVRIAARKCYLAGRAVAMGGIGDVCTHPDARRMGVSAGLLRAAIAHMQALDMPVSFLFTGLVGHYEKQGWHKVTRRTLAYVPTGEALPDGAALRPYAPDDAPLVHGLYDLYAPRLQGALVRDDAAYWERQIDAFDATRLVLTQDGAVKGHITYARLPKEEEGASWRVHEWYCAPAAEPLLPAVLTQIARAQGLHGKVLIPAALCPEMQGEAMLDTGLMVRLNSPLRLDATIATTQDLVALLDDPTFFAIDGF